MLTIKNGQILLYCHFNKIVKGPGTNFQSTTLRQKHVRIACHTAHILIALRIKKKTSISVISIMYLERYIDIYLESETLLFLQIKKSLITHQWLLYCKK